MNTLNDTNFSPDSQAIRAMAEPADLEEQETFAEPPGWPDKPEKAFYGIAGEFTRVATESSEADPMAVLITFLVYCAAAFGDGPYVPVGPAKHPARLFASIVGASSKARKGTSAKPVEAVFDLMHNKHQHIERLRVTSGPMSSGEGLAYQVRDASEETKKDSDEPLDFGITDKRLLVMEEEFGSPLMACKREGNTISPTLRTAWDSGNINPLTKTNRVKVTGAHINILAHITQPELLKLLASSDIWNGFANRFLWVCARRTRLVPIPDMLDTVRLNLFADKIATAIEGARHKLDKPISLSKEASDKWREVYTLLTQDYPGVYGAIVARGEAQVLRLALVYALLDSSYEIGLPHLEAALALWEYCNRSAHYLFGNTVDDDLSNRILSLLAEGPKSQTEIIDAFNRKIRASRLNEALKTLQACGRIDQKKESTNGRPKTFWSLTSLNQ
ncbi:DUF3987 domain-containing protein [bacterium]|nr:DUF3987 domain-containing protein [bacterium]